MKRGPVIAVFVFFVPVGRGEGAEERRFFRSGERGRQAGRHARWGWGGMGVGVRVCGVCDTFFRSASFSRRKIRVTVVPSTRHQITRRAYVSVVVIFLQETLSPFLLGVLVLPYVRFVKPFLRFYHCLCFDGVNIFNRLLF